jgi:predicted TIM-barrel fold metal-dependent hydrolase
VNKPPFIDAHAHLWDLDRLAYSWLQPPFGDNGPNGNVAPLAKTHLVADYLKEANNWSPVGMVHVEAGAASEQALDETDWLEAVATASNFPVGIVAHAALDAPNLEAQLLAQSRHLRVRGIRHIVNWHADPNRSYTPVDLTADAAWQHGFAMLGDFGFSFDCQAYPSQFPVLAELFAKHPAIPIAINHAGMGVDLDDKGREQWRDGMQMMAALDHVAVKISGLGFAWKPLPNIEARERVKEIVEMFGPDRAMVASNFPTDRLFGSFDDIMDELDLALSTFDDADRQKLFAGTANIFYRLGIDIDAAIQQGENS